MNTILELSPYYMNLYVEITDNLLERISELTDNEVTGSGLAISVDYKTDEYEYIMLLDKNASVDIIAHESVHITNMLFRDKQIKWQYNNDEPAAYMVGWIVEQIIKFKETYSLRNDKLSDVNIKLNRLLIEKCKDKSINEVYGNLSELEINELLIKEINGNRDN